MRTLKSQLCGLPVLGIKSVHEIDYEYIFIATLDPDILSIAKIMLKQMKVPSEKIIHLHYNENLKNQHMKKMGICSKSLVYIGV